MRSALALPLLLASCQQNDVSVGDLQEVMILPAIPNPNVDILFVVDSSPSMLSKQQALIASFPQMMDVLSNLEGGLPNIHIGVVTTDMGTSGTTGLVAPSIGAGPGSCSGSGQDGVLVHDVVPALGGAYFISDVRNPDGTRTRNYTGELRDVFGSLAAVGANGCGFEQPLHAMRRALDNNPANVGFLRPEANLAVVIISDEDDCSIADPVILGADTAQFGPLQSFRCTRFGVTCDGGGTSPTEMNTPGPKSECHANAQSTLISPVSPYVDFLTNLKGDPNAVMVSVIAGAPTVGVELATPPGGGTAIPALAHSCTYQSVNEEVADPAVRLAEFVAGFPARSALTSICSADLTAPMTTIGEATNRMLGDPCIATSLVDTSTEPGVQASCEVTEGPVGAETPIPQCAPNQMGSCWSLVLDTAKCAGIGDNFRLQITRPSTPTTQLYSHLRCLTR